MSKHNFWVTPTSWLSSSQERRLFRTIHSFAEHLTNVVISEALECWSVRESAHRRIEFCEKTLPLKKRRLHFVEETDHDQINYPLSLLDLIEEKSGHHLSISYPSTPALSIAEVLEFTHSSSDSYENSTLKESQEVPLEFLSAVKTSVQAQEISFHFSNVSNCYRSSSNAKIPAEPYKKFSLS